MITLNSMLKYIQTPKQLCRKPETQLAFIMSPQHNILVKGLVYSIQLLEAKVFFPRDKMLCWLYSILRKIKIITSLKLKSQLVQTTPSLEDIGRLIQAIAYLSIFQHHS
jgi:hypothetical protein